VGDAQLDAMLELEMKPHAELTQEAAETVGWRNREQFIRNAMRHAAPLN
jgi:hypothetical protein